MLGVALDQRRLCDRRFVDGGCRETLDLDPTRERRSNLSADHRSLLGVICRLLPVVRLGVNQQRNGTTLPIRYTLLIWRRKTRSGRSPNRANQHHDFVDLCNCFKTLA